MMPLSRQGLHGPVCVTAEQTRLAMVDLRQGCPYAMVKSREGIPHLVCHATTSGERANPAEMIVFAGSYYNLTCEMRVTRERRVSRTLNNMSLAY